MQVSKIEYTTKKIPVLMKYSVVFGNRNLLYMLYEKAEMIRK